MTEGQMEQRIGNRKAYVTSLEYFSQEMPEATFPGASIDISESGIGITTDYLLEPGQVILFRSKENPSALKVAVAKWSMKAGSSYRAGLMFI